MKGWTETTLSEVADIIPGYAFKGTDFGKCGVPVIKIKDICPPKVDFSNIEYVDIKKYKQKNIEKVRVFENDFVVAMTGATIGKIGKIYSSEEAYINQRVAKIRPKNFVDWNYIYYNINSSEFYQHIQNNIDSHSAQENISTTSIGRYSLQLPNLDEQRTIAAVLSSLDDKIDLLHRQNATLEAMAEALFRQWFVVEAKDEWEACALGDILQFNYGKALSERNRKGYGFPVVGSSGVVGYHNEFIVTGPGLVTGRKGTLGEVLLIKENFYPIDTTFYITSKLNFFAIYYFYFLLKIMNFGEMNSDSAVPGLNRDAAHSLEIRNAPTELIMRYEDIVANLFQKIHSNQTQIRTLEKLRDTLLPKLMSGEVRVDF